MPVWLPNVITRIYYVRGKDRTMKPACPKANVSGGFDAATRKVKRKEKLMLVRIDAGRCLCLLGSDVLLGLCHHVRSPTIYLRAVRGQCYSPTLRHATASGRAMRLRSSMLLQPPPVAVPTPGPLSSAYQTVWRRVCRHPVQLPGQLSIPLNVVKFVSQGARQILGTIG
jgi:hypothetical protein